MSRPYRIVVQKVVEQEIRAGDQSRLRLNLEQVLDQQRLEQVLGEVLERNGWQQVEPGVYQKERDDGETMSCDIHEREITTTVEVERKLREEVRKEIRGDTWNWRAMREMTQEEMAQVRREEEAKVEAVITDEQRKRAERDLARQAAEQLQQGEGERRKEVNRVVLEVMSEALKEKARELGNVERVDEAWHGEEYELTISISE